MILLGTGNSGGCAVGFGRASDIEYRSFPGQGDQQHALSVTGQGQGLFGKNGIRQEAVALHCTPSSLSILMTNNFKYVFKVALFGSL